MGKEYEAYIVYEVETWREGVGRLAGFDFLK
jgi:hypothetical protein